MCKTWTQGERSGQHICTQVQGTKIEGKRTSEQSSQTDFIKGKPEYILGTKAHTHIYIHRRMLQGI